MKKPTLDTETIFCQCLGESVAISFADDQPDEIYLSWWHQEGAQLTFWDRLRLAWNIVVHGQGWMDEIVLDHADTLRLIKALRRAVHVVWSEEEEERLRQHEAIIWVDQEDHSALHNISKRADSRKITEEVE